MLDQFPPILQPWLPRFSVAINLSLFSRRDFFIVTDTIMALNGFICAYINFDGPLVQNNLWFLILFPQMPQWSMLWPYLEALWVPYCLPSAFLRLRGLIIFSLEITSEVQTYCFWLPGHGSWDLLSPSEGTYFEDGVSHRLKCFPVSLTMENSQICDTPIFLILWEIHGLSYLSFPHRRVWTN